MTERFDAIVIGAGHNGLTCATLLARAGQRVLVLEAAGQVGGAANTREFAEGYRVSGCAHFLYQLQPEVAGDIGIEPDLAADDLPTLCLARDGQHVRLTRNSVQGVGGSDAEEYRAFRQRLTRFADLLQRYLNRPPPRLGSRRGYDVRTLARFGFDIRRLGRDEMREFLRLAGMNIHDELQERFQNPLLKGAISTDAVLGTHLGPRSPTSFLTYLYRQVGGHGRVALVAGGMGALAEKLSRIATDAGVTIRLGLPVARIVSENGRVTGVETAEGERFATYTVVSSVDPKRTVMQLLGPRYAETGFVRRIRHLRTAGNAAKLHLALEQLPAIEGATDADRAGRLLIAPDEHYVERAFNPAKYGEFSPEPVIELHFPSAHDASLAPGGGHVLSAVVQYAPYALKGGWTDDARRNFERTVVSRIADYMPAIAGSVVASELLTPADIEREYHITGGHWHHAELAFDQFLFTRPVNGAAQYRLPVDGLYLCGAGAHPGGGVTGAPGRNAARVILERGRH